MVTILNFLYKESPHPVGCGLFRTIRGIRKREETQENAALLHEFQREVVDDVSGLQNLAIDSKTDGGSAIGAEESVDSAADDDAFAAGSHGADAVGKGLIKINGQFRTLKTDADDSGIFTEDACGDQLIRDNNFVDLGHKNFFRKEELCVIIPAINEEALTGGFGGHFRCGHRGDLLLG